MTTTSHEIAIIGIGCRFPEAETVDEFWKLLTKRHSVMRPTGRINGTQLGFVDVQTPIPDIDLFDAPFFRMSAYEATLTDPQHRMFLECAYQALENGGYAGNTAGCAVGVFGSTSFSTYLFNNILKSCQRETADNYQILIHNDKDFLASRVSYSLDLRGPAITIQTACSSSLVATHLACQSILVGECEMALAGGVSLSLPQDAGHIHKPGGILSDQPSCRAFDADAAGTVKGNGCGVILLKAYTAAVADGDQIIAVIRATAINNDGGEKANFMSPTVRGQASVIREAIEVAEIAVDELDYIETHGTGTKLGDMVEAEALAMALSGRKGHTVRLGTLKPNIGHLDAAAGIAGVIKAAMVLDRQAIPAAASFDTANPDLNLEGKGFLIVSGSMLQEHSIRHAGVSSFGVGGTNAHIVMASPPRRQYPPCNRCELFLLSAQSETALFDLANRTASIIENNEWRLIDIAYTLACRRTFWPVRVAFVAQTLDDLLTQLRSVEQLLLRVPSDTTDTLTAFGTRWCRGTDADFMSLFAECPTVCLPLPGYGFDRKSYWIEPDDTDTPNKDKPVSQKLVPQGGTLASLLELATIRLGAEKIQPHVDFTEQGGDSIMLIDLLFDIQERFGIEIPVSIAMQLGTPAAIARELDHRLSQVSDSPPELLTKAVPADTGASEVRAKLVCIVPSQKRRSIVLVHPAGGTISTYVDLCETISEEEYSVYGIPFPRAFLVSPGNLTITDLAHRYVDAIHENLKVENLILGGYSFGGNVAYEMAHIFADRYGYSPNIMLFDSHPPHAYGTSLVSDAKLVETFALIIHSVMIRTGGFTVATEDIAKSYRGLSLDAAIDRLLAEGIVPIGLQADDLARFYQIWVVNHSMLCGPGRRDPAPVNTVLFNVGVSECPLILQNLGIAPVEHSAWQNYITGYLRIENLPGDHYTAFTIPENIASARDKFRALLSDDWLWQPLTKQPHTEAIL
ncbi:beta-ketoacyl synthase N-terminal-like domain-containing protein [Brucella pituitosa]|uniref:Carrier domain-containing protein n=1 Tax=Brucella pituitosa TaxID=571256 RepID=A0A643ESP8_9HYPH|nr:beta-ketoacyl synthase N-terminal-like domain-containing protein [Brucella pituitosa]KAB0564351.1 hypothetical protein F7Q93_24575 [Brucella pituitosa]